MPRKKISDIVEGRILQLLRQGYSQPRIVNILKLDGIHVSQPTVSNVKQKIGRQRNSKSEIKIFRKKPSQTPIIIKKVIKKIDVEDPPTQRAIAKDLHISQSTVSNIIKNSGFILRKKQKVQKLTSSNVMKRGQRSFPLYRRLARGRYKKFITTDEAWFYLDETGGKRKVCYIEKTDPDYDRMIIQQNTSRPKGFMVWEGVSSQGKTALRFVEHGTKINSKYYINEVLKPFLIQDVPRLFPKRRKIKWVFHQDSAPSHTAKETIKFLDQNKIHYITPQEWMPASPDAAPMDYSIWGYLKQQLNKTRIDSLDELKKRLLCEWRKMNQIYIDKVLASWPRRVLMIYKA
jgi:predicted transcriptional regulator/hemolysin-activating ACP:hemolysin acyltransferase